MVDKSSYPNEEWCGPSGDRTRQITCISHVIGRDNSRVTLHVTNAARPRACPTLVNGAVCTVLIKIVNSRTTKWPGLILEPRTNFMWSRGHSKAEYGELFINDNETEYQLRNCKWISGFILCIICLYFQQKCCHDIFIFVSQTTIKLAIRDVEFHSSKFQKVFFSECLLNCPPHCLHANEMHSIYLLWMTFPKRTTTGIVDPSQQKMVNARETNTDTVCRFFIVLSRSPNISGLLSVIRIDVLTPFSFLFYAFSWTCLSKSLPAGRKTPTLWGCLLRGTIPLDRQYRLWDVELDIETILSCF